MDTQYQADRLRIIVIIRIRYDVRVFDVYKPCCAIVASSVTFILGEKVESGGERDVCGEVSSLKRVGEKEIVEGVDERASRRKTYVKIVCTREGIYWTRDKFRVNF